MVLTDPITNAFNTMKNAERVGKKDCSLKPASKLLGNILKVVQKEGYIGNFELIDDGKSGVYKVQLVGRINKCSSVIPNYSVKKDEYEKYEKRYLPAKKVGFLVISTPNGLMTQKEAQQRKVGGKVLGYMY